MVCDLSSAGGLGCFKYWGGRLFFGAGNFGVGSGGVLTLTFIVSYVTTLTNYGAAPSGDDRCAGTMRASRGGDRDGVTGPRILSVGNDVANCSAGRCVFRTRTGRMLEMMERGASSSIMLGLLCLKGGGGADRLSNSFRILPCAKSCGLVMDRAHGSTHGRTGATGGFGLGTFVASRRRPSGRRGCIIGCGYSDGRGLDMACRFGGRGADTAIACSGVSRRLGFSSRCDGGGGPMFSGGGCLLDMKAVGSNIFKSSVICSLLSLGGSGNNCTLLRGYRGLWAPSRGWGERGDRGRVVKISRALYGYLWSAG